ncbi:hypothetical protein SERLA73DRAFT_181829 [Serpula lacrymans var. lacrymans S7.3]|uniref:Uncharacterized protein n=2 Tax=Serpula lacrymans var. lacrymans TaxID=341189 RepID=F8PYT3_SERL3|nr:uncharacterized protein SERLADRAFT_468202 [Serpula lacrymans var. lacrymans S7.9]EGN99046.1 hypothetical protein SERLA73DRAFT_181829 [Serpula lacrymans var. lacrymans S7.3]EGO24621.1 hypothetical protein SERLADRAFT_468202 [Serpula lacrymans var. lacrymans S7.9]
MLEDEVKRLKEELSKRSIVRPSPDPHSLMPAPPPPPPPLPPPLPVRISTTQLGSISDAGSMFLSARAALRQAGPPAEAPINAPSLGRAKRQGQPTVNLS